MSNGTPQAPLTHPFTWWRQWLHAWREVGWLHQVRTWRGLTLAQVERAYCRRCARCDDPLPLDHAGTLCPHFCLSRVTRAGVAEVR